VPVPTQSETPITAKETAGKALKHGHFQQFPHFTDGKNGTRTRAQNFPGFRKNLIEFRVYFEIFRWLHNQFDAIRKGTLSGRRAEWKS